MKRTTVFLFAILALGSANSWGQYFGKNKVQYTYFNWQYLQSEHFDIYFTDGGQGVATFVAQVAEKSYQELQQSLRYDLVERIKIIVYNSHNDFGQTNVDLSPPEESVGGFTEFFKNRVVIPYEGEWEKFRHVIHHELTHAVMLQMLYGAGVQSIITGLSQLQLPLWLVEGLAEYESRGWDIESDMYMRDATLAGYVPEIDYLYGFLAYKGGQSVLDYLAERYGREKIGELLGKIKINKSVESGLQQSIGMDVEQLTERWHRHLKRKYWPDVENRLEPDEFSKQLTFHHKDRSFVNTSPAVSNRGDKLAYISDRDDFFDIYLMSAIDGRVLQKLVRGQRAGNLEELKWLRGPNISWSPDDRQVVFTAKTAEEDALHFVDVKDAEIVKSIKLDLDGIYNPAWSPDGQAVAFMALKNGQSDLYVYHITEGQLQKITNDIFSNIEPKWSPDGSKIVFASDRGSYLERVPENFEPKDIDMKNYDIYEINNDGSDLRRLVQSEFIERTPIYSPDGGKIAFTSDRSGVNNIYLKDLETGEEWPITNAITGVFQPSWGGEANRLVFASFFQAGYDLYQMKNPLDIKPGEIEVQETRFVQSLKADQEKIERDEWVYGDSSKTAINQDTRKYRNFVFDEAFAAGNIQPEDQTQSVFLDSSQFILPSGEFKVKQYDVKFSPDLVYGAVGYNQFFGTQGYTNILLSDVLGNHRLNIAANLFGDLKNADYMVTYLYLPRRLDIGFSGYHNAYYFYSDFSGWVKDRNYGLGLMLSNPFDRYTRLSYGMTLMGISRAYLDIPDEITDDLIDLGYLSPRNRFFALNNITYTKDNTIWGMTGPANGSRYALGVTYSPQLGKNGIDFTTLHLDWRRYSRLSRNYSFALRFSGGASFGRHPQKFFLGGVPNWLNRDYTGGIRVDRIEEIYFASFEMPLRGAGFYELEGNRFLLSNIEFRFPLIKRLSMGFPLPLELGNVGGALFTDMGLAWDNGDEVKPFVRAPNGLIRTRDVFASFGLGVRIYLGFFLLRVDMAWPTDFYITADSPQYLWSLGADF
ncbi:PD40 domain-containing protein [candidate division KSB1 bacterium]|nr:PD40 domain-containing protein [candidate division KSB1 bacterium]